MVVVTVESIATKNATKAHDLSFKLNLVSEDESSAQTLCVVSKTMLRSHRRTLSPDKVLFLKAPGHITPPSMEQKQTRDVSSFADRKRPALEEPRISAPPVKRARLIVLAPVPPAAGAAAPLPVRRTVHFELQDKETTVVKTHVRFFERVDSCDVANLWWSGEEMLGIMSREKSAISVMSFCCDHYTSEVLNLMKIARDKTSLPGNATSESSSPVWVASSPARGLERDIVQGFKQRKRQVIRKVLESQRLLKMGRHQETGESAPAELQSQVLSTQYRKWSQPMARFAQVLAEGDAQVVIDNTAAAAAARAFGLEGY